MDIEGDDLEIDIDDIIANQAKRSKKKKNSGLKGKRGERGLVDILTERFPGKAFSRTIGSGARVSQARLSEAAKQVFTGDIVCPEEFLFTIECKHGYNKIQLERAVKRWLEGKSGNKLLDSFLAQAQKDGNRIKKKPMMCWKKDYQPWLAFLKTDQLPADLQSYEAKVQYKEWTAFPLERVLEMPDSFFIKA